MGILITLGGGEFNLGETENIDRYALELTGKQRPHILYIPTASEDKEEHMMDDYFNSFGCEYDTLCLISKKPSLKEINEKIQWADYVFAGGGDAILLMDIWKKTGTDLAMKNAFDRGCVLSGISAGSICYYDIGHTDSMSYHSEDWDYYRMEGMGLIHAIHSPHFCEKRRESLIKWMKNETIPGVGLDNCCALMCIDGKYSAITTDSKAKAHIFRNVKGSVEEEYYGDGDCIIL